MYIFDLDGTLADCEHRRHFVDKRYITCGINCTSKHRCIFCLRNLEKDQPDWKSFNESCDKDKQNWPVCMILKRILASTEVFNYPPKLDLTEIEIWSGRSESVREKTVKWLSDHVCKEATQLKIRMRPIGDYTPDHELKEKWLKEHIAEGGKPIEAIFEDRKCVVDMWRRNGIICFQVAEGDF